MNIACPFFRRGCLIANANGKCSDIHRKLRMHWGQVYVGRTSALSANNAPFSSPHQYRQWQTRHLRRPQTRISSRLRCSRGVFYPSLLVLARSLDLRSNRPTKPLPRHFFAGQEVERCWSLVMGVCCRALRYLQEPRVRSLHRVPSAPDVGAQ